jgi:anti-sigma factor RsiW
MLHAHVDGELDLVTTLNLERHIHECNECAADRRELAALRSALGDGSLYFRASAKLERRIRSSLPRTPSSTRHAAAALRWVAAAAAVVLVATTTWLVARRSAGTGAEQLLATEVTSAHVRSLMAEHLWDVRSTDQHTVKPWFHGKLDFAPDVRDFAAASYALEGGRLDYLSGRPVAAIVYRHDKHFINLFTWPAAAGQSDQEVVAATQQGHVLLHWVQDHMQYWAISDTSVDTLRRFVDAVRTGGRPAALKAPPQSTPTLQPSIPTESRLTHDLNWSREFA